MSSDPWSEWAGRRPMPQTLHFDSAACGRQSEATLAVTAEHARLEAEFGAYVAQEQAADVLEQLRSDVARLLGVRPDGLAFVESATAGLHALLGCWPLPADATIGVVPVEWGPNLEIFAAYGLGIRELGVDAAGRIDLAALERQLATDPPTVVHLTQVTSHRGLVQPVAEALALCRSAGVPLWVDAAQALGHVDAAVGADATYATSRKWLTGPRGVGLVAVAQAHWDALRVRRPAMAAAELAPVAYLESHEAHVAGRVGLANAVAEYRHDGPDAIIGRLDEVGRLTREVLDGVPGWALVGPGGSGAITALRPTAGQDVFAVRERLRVDHGILTTAGATTRAPRDMAEPMLRISPHVDCTALQLAGLRAALPAG